MRTLGSRSICGHRASCDLQYFPVRQASNALMPGGEEAYRDEEVIKKGGDKKKESVVTKHVQRTHGGI